jgi:hypothetical protein
MLVDNARRAAARVWQSLTRGTLMLKNHRRARPTVAGWWVALLALCASGTAAYEPPPVADFFRYSTFANPVLSPSGKHVAALVKAGAGGRRGLVVFDTADLAKVNAVARYADMDIIDAKWVNDERLVFRIADLQAPGGDQLGSGLFAVDREGRQPVKGLIRRWFTTDEIGGMVAARGARVGESGLSVFHFLM